MKFKIKSEAIITATIHLINYYLSQYTGINYTKILVFPVIHVKLKIK